VVLFTVAVWYFEVGELQQGGKEAIEIAWRVLEANGVIPIKDK